MSESIAAHNPVDELYNRFPQFYKNPVIARLAFEPRWTVSDRDKKPLDFVSFREGRIQLAAKHDETCLVTLHEVMEAMPTANNHTFRITAPIDEVCILDIEPYCDPLLKAKFLNLPAYYTEVSMSGNGIHMVMPLPESFHQYPDAQNKVALKSPLGYEIMLNHMLTFTREPVPKKMRDALPATSETVDFNEIYVELAATARPSVKVTFDAKDTPDIPHQDYIIERLKAVTYSKTPEQFANDMSRWEYGYMSSLFHCMQKLIDLPSVNRGHKYTPSERTHLLYLAAKLHIPERPKHSEVRDGMPFLKSLAAKQIASELLRQEEILEQRRQRAADRKAKKAAQSQPSKPN